jgi:peptide-methionine (R)-S-oxide reductase
MKRRRFFTLLGGIGASALLTRFGLADDSEQDKAHSPEAMSDEHWKQTLSAEQYHVLRKEGTEAPGSSPLLSEGRRGLFVCAACGAPLFRSTSKYDSGTGWPSFFSPIEGAVATKTDYKLLWPRTEYHCANCGGHQGHVFDDGPQPTGLRYCNNGVALNFVPQEGK